MSERAQRVSLTLASVGFAVYVGSIVLANWMLLHVGAKGPGVRVLPVGFGLVAPSGVYVAALAFVARDIVQRFAGARMGVVAIIVGAVLSALVATPTLAIASGLTFLLSETTDFLLFQPLQRRSLPGAVLGAGLAAIVVDSVVFLSLAGIPLAVALPGQLLGKCWVVLAGSAATIGLRHVTPAPALRPRPAS